MLVPKHFERTDHAHARLRRVNHVVNEPARCRHIRVGRQIAVLLHKAGTLRVLVLGVSDRFAVDDVDRARRPHDGDLRRGPRVVHVGPQVLAPHDDVSAAVRLAGQHAHLGHRRLRIGVDELGAVLDDAAVLLFRPRQEARDVDEREDGHVEGVTESNEARRLEGCVDVERTCQVRRLLSDDAHRVPVHPPEAHDDVLGVVGLHLKEVAAVHNGADYFLHVVRLVLAVRHDGAQRLAEAVGVVAAVAPRRVLGVARGQEIQEPTHLREALFVAGEGKVGDAAEGRVRVRPAELLVRHLFARYGLDDVRAGDVHLPGALRHEDEVCDGRRVDGAARTRAHDDGDLRHHTRCQRV